MYKCKYTVFRNPKTKATQGQKLNRCHIDYFCTNLQFEFKQTQF